MSPVPGRSTLITSAPNQARSCVQVGPDCTWVKSRMRTPSSALVMVDSPEVGIDEPDLRTRSGGRARRQEAPARHFQDGQGLLARTTRARTRSVAETARPLAGPAR